MVMWYWSVAILFWQLSIDHFVNVQYTRCGLAKTRLRHPSLPFDSLPDPTLTICRRVRSVNHVTTKWKEVDHILWVWGSVPRALRARVGVPLKFSPKKDSEGGNSDSLLFFSLPRSQGGHAIYHRNARILDMWNFTPFLHEGVDVRADDFLRNKISWMHR